VAGAVKDAKGKRPLAKFLKKLGRVIAYKSIEILR